MAPVPVLIRRINAEQALPIRRAVLWPDHPESFSRVANDEAGWHFGAFCDNQLVGVGSIFLQQDEAWLRKFAVRPEWQARGIGSALLARMIEDLKAAQVARLRLNARQSAVAFYQRFGMRPEGEPFKKEGIPYIGMNWEAAGS